MILATRVCFAAQPTLKAPGLEFCHNYLPSFGPEDQIGGCLYPMRSMPENTHHFFYIKPLAPSEPTWGETPPGEQLAPHCSFSAAPACASPCSSTLQWHGTSFGMELFQSCPTLSSTVRVSLILHVQALCTRPVNKKQVNII